MTGETARALSAHGLRSELRLPRDALSAEQWDELMTDVATHKLSGLLVDAIEFGAMPVNDGQFDQSLALHGAAMERVLKLDRLLLEVTAELSGAGVVHRILKGAAHAHLLYPDPTLRPYVDVDLLVPGRQFNAAVLSLNGAGIERPAPELRPRFDERFGKGATLRASTGEGIDLHRTFVDGPYGVIIDADRLFDHTAPVEIGGSTLSALGREERFIHTCFHAAVSDCQPSLLALRDVAQASNDPCLDVDRAVRLISEFRAEPVVARALSKSWSMLALSDVPAVVERYRGFRANRSEDRVMAAYAGVEHRWARRSLAALPYVKGVGAKCAYARAVLAPTRHAVRDRGRSRGSMWWEGLRSLRRPRT